MEMTWEQFYDECAKRFGEKEHKGFPCVHLPPVTFVDGGNTHKGLVLRIARTAGNEDVVSCEANGGPIRHIYVWEDNRCCKRPRLEQYLDLFTQGGELSWRCFADLPMSIRYQPAAADTDKQEEENMTWEEFYDACAKRFGEAPGEWGSNIGQPAVKLPPVTFTRAGEVKTGVIAEITRRGGNTCGNTGNGFLYVWEHPTPNRPPLRRYLQMFDTGSTIDSHHGTARFTISREMSAPGVGSGRFSGQAPNPAQVPANPRPQKTAKQLVEEWIHDGVIQSWSPERRRASRTVLLYEDPRGVGAVSIVLPELRVRPGELAPARQFTLDEIAKNFDSLNDLDLFARGLQPEVTILGKKYTVIKKIGFYQLEE